MGWGCAISWLDCFACVVLFCYFHLQRHTNLGVVWLMFFHTYMHRVIWFKVERVFDGLFYLQWALC